ncbi:hypothetical protein D3C86_1027020 [compost metagenome]
MAKLLTVPVKVTPVVGVPPEKVGAVSTLLITVLPIKTTSPLTFMFPPVSRGAKAFPI